MNTEQRVLAALRLEQPDRVPVFVYLNPYDRDAWYAEDPSYAELLEAARRHADVIYDWHFPMGLFGSAAELARQSSPLDDGATRHTLHTPAGPVTSIVAPDWRGGGPRKRWVSKETDARRLLSVPYRPSRPDLAEFIRTRRRLAGRAVAQVTFPDPICLIGDIVDPEVLAVWTLRQRALLRELLQVALERVQDALRYCLDGGIGPIYYFNGPEYALPPLMSPADFEEFVVQPDAQLVGMIHSCPGRCVILHSHGRVSRFLERFAAIGMDGLNVLEPPPLGDTDLADAKARVGDRFCLIGNIQYDDLARGSGRDIERLVADAIAAAAPGGGFILSPCASPYECPLPKKAGDNLIRYLIKGREYGRYPLRPRTRASGPRRAVRKE